MQKEEEKPEDSAETIHFADIKDSKFVRPPEAVGDTVILGNATDAGDKQEPMIRRSLQGINKKAFGKALGLVLLSWLALPILYFMFCKKEKKNE